MKTDFKRINVNVQPKDYEVFDTWSNTSFSTWVREQLAEYASKMRERREAIREHHKEEAECNNL